MRRLISIESLAKKASREKRKSHRWAVTISIVIIIVTGILVFYLYPKIEYNKQLLFLIGYIWPGSVIVVLVSMWARIIKDSKRNRGHDIYELLQKEVSQKFEGSSKKSYFLMRIINRKEEFHSADKATRKKALKDIVEEINDAISSSL